MSDNTNTIEQESQVQTGQADGSPPPAQPETTTAPAQAEGGAPAQEAAQVQELRRKLTEQAEQLAGYRDVVELVKSDPALLNAVKSKIGEGTPPDDFATMDKVIDDGFEEGSAKLLKGLLRDAVEAAERRVLQQVRPLAQEVGRTRAESQFLKGMKDSGLDPLLYEDSDFQAHLKELRSTRAYSAAEREDPAGAAEWAASRWQSKTGATQNYAADKRRIEFARSGSSSYRGGPNRGIPPATTTPRKAVRWSQGLRAILDATNDGTPLDNIDVT